MKVRIYYKGYDDLYRCQYRKYGIWWNFKKWVGGGCYDAGYTTNRSFATLEEAKAWMASARAEYINDNKSRAAAKERDKKSGVVYTETW